MTITARLLTRREVLALSILMAIATDAAPQSMTPMRDEIKSFSDAFAVRVYPSNPYSHRIKIEMKVYDQAFAEIPANIAPKEFTLGSNGSRSVTVIVPFNGSNERKVRICTESIPFPNQQTQIRTQICGNFLGSGCPTDRSSCHRGTGRHGEGRGRLLSQPKSKRLQSARRFAATGPG